MKRIGLCFNCVETFIGGKSSIFCKYCLQNGDKQELDELRKESKELLRLSF